MARYKQPRRAFFLTELTKSGCGKVTIRQELKDRGWIDLPAAKVSA